MLFLFISKATNCRRRRADYKKSAAKARKNCNRRRRRPGVAGAQL